MSVEEQVLDCVNEISSKKIKLEEAGNISFIRDLEFDSIQIINLVLRLEEKFKIEFTDKEIISDDIKTFAGICKVIKER